MPQAPLPNTGIVLPSDLGDGDQWAFLLDACFRDYDGHTHAAGDGAQIHIGSIAIDSDINFSDAVAVKHAIFNLKAVDFFATAPAALASFAGALFLADGTGGTVANELYYRTTLGANVQMTSGATLNVNAFTGGIGGDYSAVGALEKFDDALDAYWFSQQLGAGVQQYAKMRCADVALFEFRAAGVTPLPPFAVTLRSPVALAGNYSLTMPGALPVGATPALLAVDSAGNISAGAVQTLTIPLKPPLSGSGPSAVALAAGGTDPACFPFALPVGRRILRIRAKAQDTNAPTTFKVGLMTWDGNTASASNFGTNSAGDGTIQTVLSAAMTVTVVSGSSYYAEITINAGAGTCSIKSVEVDHDQS